MQRIKINRSNRVTRLMDNKTFNQKSSSRSTRLILEDNHRCKLEMVDKEHSHLYSEDGNFPVLGYRIPNKILGQYGVSPTQIKNGKTTLRDESIIEIAERFFPGWELEEEE